MMETATRQPLLRVSDLCTYFRTEDGVAKAVDGVSFDVFPGEVLGIVGESGSGKSVTALSIPRLIPEPPGWIAAGEILFRGAGADQGQTARDLLQLDIRELRQIRGEIGMIFQEPMTSLNPVITIGRQVMEPLRAHGMSRREAFNRAVEMLGRVGIPDAARRMRDYPHQLSGGMRQRVMIATALICNPPLLIADEPTTVLDVTTQAQILDLMLELKRQHASGSVILITHDLSVVARTCDRVVVLYGGRVQEVGSAAQIFDDPRHPYTQGLLASLPARGGNKQTRLKAIPGNVPAMLDLPTGCKFCTRCAQVIDRCGVEEPVLHRFAGRAVRCHLMETSESD